MDATAIRNVNQIPADEKRALETLLGATLEPEQQVLILTYRRNVRPDDDARQAARQRIADTIAVNQQFAVSQGVSPEEADAAIDEAMSQIRHRP
jgi:hypothetical protein